MSRNFLESDEVDSKKFMGRVLTLLGEIIHNQEILMDYLEDSFHVPEEHQRMGGQKERVRPDERSPSDFDSDEDEL